MINVSVQQTILLKITIISKDRIMREIRTEIQIDAPISPGNSGGPAIADGKILGIVFSGIPRAENIGYLIPSEEIVTFLDDVADGTYEGKPRLFGRFQTVENESLRERLKLSSEQGGMMVTGPDSGYPPVAPVSSALP